VGHFDLSCSLGVPGQFESKIFKDAIDRVTAACQANNKALGRLVPDVATGVALAQRGHDFICYSGDVWLLGAAIREGVAAIRQGVAAGGPKPSARTAASAGKAPAKGVEAASEQAQKAPEPKVARRQAKGATVSSGSADASSAAPGKSRSGRRRGGQA
jgi:2-dehydro-3-deoxyglucarate aldolase/4-hydroxy-2-oxoheptanedioate aldolase